MLCAVMQRDRTGEPHLDLQVTQLRELDGPRGAAQQDGAAVVTPLQGAGAGGQGWTQGRRATPACTSRHK